MRAYPKTELRLRFRSGVPGSAVKRLTDRLLGNRPISCNFTLLPAYVVPEPVMLSLILAMVVIGLFFISLLS